MPTKVTLQTGATIDRVERRAADELQRYIRLLFGFTLPVSTQPVRSGIVISIGTPQSNPPLARKADRHELGDQDYAVRRVSPGRLEICGGSPPAVLWGVYELIEQWGVTYLLQGDVLPDPAKVGAFALPRIDVVRRPVFDTRVFRFWGDMLNSNAAGGLADHVKLFDQFAKLRFNAVLGGINPFHPFVHWGFRGVERDQAGLFYGWKHAIHERTIGREVIGQTGDFTNPDLVGAETYEEQLAAGRRLLTHIIEAAHDRGIKVVLSFNLSEFPEEIQRNLPRWSRGRRIPPSTLNRQYVHTVGLNVDGCGYRFGHLLTPHNPVYVDLIETSMAAVIDQYPQLDGLFVTQAEFPPEAGGIEECWRQLDQRHGLKPEFTFNKLMKQARSSNVMGGIGRAVHEAKGAVVTIRLLDKLLNERPKVRELIGTRVKLYGSFISEVLMPVLPRVFDPNLLEFAGTIDYLPVETAKRMHTMDFTRGTGFRTHLFTVINDDNVGFPPQYNMRALHTTMRAMRRYDVKGYWFRWYDQTQYEPIVRYMAQAGWDAKATPNKTYEQLLTAVCGKAGLAQARKAFAMLEAIVPDVNAVCGTGFMVPHMMSKYWEPFDAFWEQTDYTRGWARLIAHYEKIETQFAKAIAVCAPRGAAFLEKMLMYVRFNRLFIESTTQVRHGRRRYEQARRVPRPRGRREKFDMDTYNGHMHAAVDHLETAIELLEQAVRVWADQVSDAPDVGTLVGLNVYALDYLRGKTDEVRMESEIWAKEF